MRSFLSFKEPRCGSLIAFCSYFEAVAPTKPSKSQECHRYQTPQEKIQATLFINNNNNNNNHQLPQFFVLSFHSVVDLMEV